MTVQMNAAPTFFIVDRLQDVLDEHQPAGTHKGHVCVCGATVLGTNRRAAWNRHRAAALARAGFEQTVNGTHPGTLDKVARQVAEACPDTAKMLATQAAVLRGLIP